MSAVTGKRMAETMAGFGGLGVLPQDMEPRHRRADRQAHPAADARYDTRSPSRRVRRCATSKVSSASARTTWWSSTTSRRPIGIVTHADLRDRTSTRRVGA
jgi:IMP dehydrogenase